MTGIILVHSMAGDFAFWIRRFSSPIAITSTKLHFREILNLQIGLRSRIKKGDK